MRTSVLTRRGFIQHVALASVLSGCASAGLGGRAGFSFGPAAADVTSRSALIWLRPTGRSRVQVEYGLDAGLAGALTTAAVEATAETNYTATVNLVGLEPGRQYFYRGVRLPTEPGLEPVRGPIGRFRTPPEAAREFRFAWSGDIEAGHQPFTLLDAVVRRNPDFFVLLGDTIYADVPKARADLSLGGYRWKHRENRADPHLQRLLASTAVVAIWDDHEVENDFDGTHPGIPEGRRAFREYWPVRTHSADPSILYRRLAWGPGADFFVLDCRQYRSPKEQGDGFDKTMLGRAQKEWLEQQLRASRASFKFVVSSVPFLGSWGPDKWSGYATERAELQRFIATERIGGVVFLSADIHAAMELEGRGVREFIAGPIAAWPLCQLVRDIRPRLEATGRFFICDAFNFGLVTVRPEKSPPEAEVEILDGASAVRYRAVVRAGHA